MRLLDAHCHVFEYLSSFRGEGEIRAIGGGKARWANGQIVSMIPPHLGDKGFETETLVKFLREKGVEKAVLLQGSFYGFHNEYVAEAMKTYPDLFLGAGTFDPFAKYADQIYERLTYELGFRVLKFETSTGGGGGCATAFRRRHVPVLPSEVVHAVVERPLHALLLHRASHADGTLHHRHRLLVL